jgi:hypothetical protein
LFALSPCKEVLALLDSKPITKEIISTTEQENQQDSEEKVEKVKEDQIISKPLFWGNLYLLHYRIHAMDFLHPSENHSKTETPPPNSTL